MTEKEWMECTDPGRMLEFLRGKASDRKRRLFGVACCRRISHLLPGKSCQKALNLVECFADGQASKNSLRKAEDAGYYYGDGGYEDGTPKDRLIYHAAGAIFQLGQELISSDIVAEAASDAVSCSVLAAGDNQVAANAAKNDECTAQCRLLHDIFGNGFRPITLDATWLTPTVTSLAQGIYQDRTFSDLPILADALEEAGCNNDDILSHLRGTGPHTRGCWALDLVLGKK